MTENAGATRANDNGPGAETDTGDPEAARNPKPVAPPPGAPWTNIGPAWIKRERKTIAWSWTGETDLILTPGSIIIVRARDGDIAPGAPGFDFAVRVLEEGEYESRGYTAAEPNRDGSWSTLGGAWYKEDKGQINWRWTGKEALRLPPGSAINVWPSKNQKTPDSPQFYLRCCINDENAASGAPAAGTAPKGEAADWVKRMAGGAAGTASTAAGAPSAEAGTGTDAPYVGAAAEALGDDNGESGSAHEAAEPGAPEGENGGEASAETGDPGPADDDLAGPGPGDFAAYGSDVDPRSLEGHPSNPSQTSGAARPIDDDFDDDIPF